MEYTNITSEEKIWHGKRATMGEPEVELVVFGNDHSI